MLDVLEKGFECDNSNSDLSLLEVNLDTGQFGGEDLFDLSDDGDFLLSVFGVLGILGSHGVAFSFLLLETFGGNSEFLGGVELSLLL